MPRKTQVNEVEVDQATLDEQARNDEQARKDAEKADNEAQLNERQKAAQDARSKQVAFNPVTGVMGPHDFDGTTPEEIAKMAPQRVVGNLPLGPGQVTGGISISSGKANETLPQPSGGDRTPGQGGNPDADTMNRQSTTGIAG